MKITTIAAVLSGAALAAPSLAAVAEYLPAQGTVPSAQGWTYGGTGSEIGSVSSGIFSYGPTSTANYHYWQPTTLGPANFASETWSIEADIRLTDTFHGNNSGYMRGGFVLVLQDDLGNGIVADMGSASLGLRNDGFGNGDPTMAFNLASAFHTVKLMVGPSGGSLWIDGVQQLTLALGGIGNAADVSFGESSILAYTGLTEIGRVTVTPAPAGVGLLAAGGLLAARRRRHA